MRFLLVASVALAALAATPAFAQSPVWSGDGTLADSDRATEDGHRYDDHVVRLQAGQRYRISLDSDAFDPVLRLYRSTSEEPVAENDDGGESLNSRLSFQPPESGDYVLRATSYSADGRGAYSARVETQAPLPPPVTTPGQSVSATGTWSLWQGALTASDPDVDGRHYRDYLIRMEAGQTRYISLTASDFDPIVQIFAASERGNDTPMTLDEDDDGGVGLNSFMVFQPEVAGDYIVRVMSLGSGGTGPYTLYVSQ